MPVDNYIAVVNKVNNHWIGQRVNFPYDTWLGLDAIAVHLGRTMPHIKIPTLNNMKYGKIRFLVSNCFTISKFYKFLHFKKSSRKQILNLIFFHLISLKSLDMFFSWSRALKISFANIQLSPYIAFDKRIRIFFATDPLSFCPLTTQVLQSAQYTLFIFTWPC